MKTQKGITLIALIITIIVMLILVGVSVSIALNSGLFKAAQGGAKNTEAERINETKLSTGTVNIGGEEVDISNIENINAALEKQKLKEQGYTHKLIAESGENTFECYVKEDTTFEQLDTLYDEVSVASESDNRILVFGLFVCWFDPFTQYDESGENYGCESDVALDNDRVLDWFTELVGYGYPRTSDFFLNELGGYDGDTNPMPDIDGSIELVEL